MKVIYLAAALALGGCATTVGGIQKEDIVASYTSGKTPLDVAKCMQAQVPGLDIEFPGSDVSVSARNPYGSILINWLIHPAESGSKIDVRRATGITAGISQATACF